MPSFSDTLLFRSPTCTAIDRMVAEKLGMIAKIDLESFAKEMFAAGSNLKNKTEEQIFFPGLQALYNGIIRGWSCPD